MGSYGLFSKVLRGGLVILNKFFYILLMVFAFQNMHLSLFLYTDCKILLNLV